MSEIAKLYQNAGIKLKYSGWLDMGDLDTQMTHIQCDTKEEWDECVFMSRSSYSSDYENYDKPKMEYPPFTAKKQLELIKFLLKKAVYYDVKDDKYWFYYEECESAGYKPFDEAIAHFINKLWQSLTEEEKQQIKEILNG